MGQPPGPRRGLYGGGGFVGGRVFGKQTGAGGRLFSGGGTVLPALQWGSLLAPGVDFMAGVLPLEAWLGKNGGRRRGGSCCGSVGVVTAGGDFLGVRGVVVGVFVAP